MLRLGLAAFLFAACSDSGITTYADNDPAIPNGGAGGGSCSPVALTPTPVAYFIQLMIDGSGSMGSENLNGTRKNTVVKNAVAATVPTYQAGAQFGVTTFTSENTCPKFYSAPCALGNATAIATAINTANSNNDGSSFDPLTEALPKMVTNFPTTPGKKIIIFATDGVPNSCTSNSVDHSTQAVQAAADAYTAGVSTYVIGLGNGDGAGDWSTFLQNLATAGVGTTAPAPVDAQNQTDVENAYKALFDQVLDCEFTLDGTIDVSQASLGTVQSNGTTLAFTTDWVAVDTKTIKLVGAACTSYKTATALPEITATFTCGASH